MTKLEQELLAKLAVFEAQISKFETKISDLEKQVAIIPELQKQVDTIPELKKEIARLEELNAYLKLIKFGKKSEKINPDQLSFFNELEFEQELDEVTKIIEVKSHKKAITKKPNLVNDEHNLAIEIVEHHLDNNNCPDCNNKMTEFGYEIRKELCVKPMELYIKEHRYFKCVCNECKNDDVVNIISAPRDNVSFPNSMVSASLVSHLIVDKYLKALPLYRQELMWLQHNVNLSRQDMSNYMAKAANILMPLYNRYAEILRSSYIIHADETPLQVMHSNGKVDGSKSYMWVYTSSRADNLIYYYHYCQTRSGNHPREFLREAKTKYLLTDGYAGYNNIDNITRVCCFAHARRKFYDAINVSAGNKKLAYEGYNYINQLFTLESKYLDDKLSYEEIKASRLDKQIIILNRLKEYLDLNRDIVVPTSKLGQAISYSLNQWESLNNYLLDGRLELSNNRAERAVKPFVVGRKNWLFCMTDKGAQTSSVLYTIVQTALYNDLSVYKYLEYAIENILDTRNIDDLLPWSNSLPDELRVKQKMK